MLGYDTQFVPAITTRSTSPACARAMPPDASLSFDR